MLCDFKELSLNFKNVIVYCGVWYHECHFKEADVLLVEVLAAAACRSLVFIDWTFKSLTIPG